MKEHNWCARFQTRLPMPAWRALRGSWNSGSARAVPSTASPPRSLRSWSCQAPSTASTPSPDVGRPHFHPTVRTAFTLQDRFLPLDPGPWGNVYRSGPYLVFVAENQGVWEVATLAQGDDPSVWVSEDCSHRGPNPIWRPLDNPLSHFLVTFVLQEMMFGSEFLACHEDALSVFARAGCQCEPSGPMGSSLGPVSVTPTSWLTGASSYAGTQGTSRWTTTGMASMSLRSPNSSRD